MWLVVTFITALTVFAVHLLMPDLRKYPTGSLSLMLFGVSIMILADHIIPFMDKGGEFLEFQTEGFIPSGVLLGLVMLVPIFAVWAVSLVSGKKPNPE